MSWQKRARAGVGLFAVLFAAGVYFAMGERQKAAPRIAVEREDPTSTLEVMGAILSRFSGSDEDFVVEADSKISYPDGSERSKGLRITIKKRNGRDVTISADEALVGANESTFDLKQNIVLKASDGFELHTDNATFNNTERIVRAPGSVTFSRGRMAGSGIGMTYAEDAQILTLASDSQVALSNEAGVVTTSFESGSSSLDRAANVLTLQDRVHVVRDAQEFDATHGVARLSEDEAFVRHVELRGQARVSSGGAVDAMSARDIDLDYSDDGTLLERVILVGDAGMALKGANGAPARQIHGGRLDLTLAADGTVNRIIGQEGVRLVLPPDDDTPPRTITARTLDAIGESGKGLTHIEFRESVDYREGAGTARARDARSQSLRLTLLADAVAEATFTGNTTFRDGALQASANEARYSPSKGTLGLSGGAPEVSDEQVVINGTSIDVAFETRHMVAEGRTRTTYTGTPAKGRGASEPATKMPGLLKPNQPVTVTAGTLDYTGSTSAAVYTGVVELRQGAGTFIRANRLTLDQESGDLTASGNARAILVGEADASSTGTADEIRYTDTTRVIAYTTPAPATSRVVSAEGDLTASRIDITLQKEGSGVARIDAQHTVSIQVDPRTITGVRLEYIAPSQGATPTDGGSYVVYGDARHPVTVLNRATCERSSGMMKLTMSKATDNIVLEGGGLALPRVDGTGTCAPVAPPSPGSTTRPPTR